MILSKLKQWGKLLTLSLVVAAGWATMPGAQAYYSPTLDSEVSFIKRHVIDARGRHGVGSFFAVYRRFVESPDNKEIPGGYWNYFTDSSVLIGKNLLTNFWDGISLLVGTFIPISEEITNCRRDDIWGLQALQEEVLNEMLKASLLLDHATSAILWTDFKKLDGLINGGEYEDGTPIFSLKTHFRDTEYWFPGQTKNLYLDCPYGEFQQAFNEVQQSLERLKASFEPNFYVRFGALPEQLVARSKRRAAEYIKANQIQFTLGGAAGGSPTKLIRKSGIEGLAADLKTNLVYAENYANLVFKNTFETSIEDYNKRAQELRSFVQIDDVLEARRRAERQRDLVLDQSEKALTYNLQLQDVSEQGLIEIERALWETNKVIQNAYLTTASTENLLGFCKKLHHVAKNQCKSKTGGAVPSCTE